MIVFRLSSRRLGIAALPLPRRRGSRDRPAGGGGLEVEHHGGGVQGEVHREIRAIGNRDRDLQRVPLVVVTNDVAQARLLSAQAMVTRPVSREALEEVVEQLAHVTMV